MVNRATYYGTEESTPLWLSVLATAFVLSGVGIAAAMAALTEPVPITGRRRPMLLTREAEEEHLGAQSREVVRALQLLPADDRVVQAVQVVVRRLGIAIDNAVGEWEDAQRPRSGKAVQSAADELAHRPAPARQWWHSYIPDPVLAAVGLLPPSQHKWRVYVSRSTEVNAFAAPGGYVVVHRGLLAYIDKLVQASVLVDRESALAAVLAHEMAHVVARHSAEHVSTLPLKLWLSAMTGASSLIVGMYAVAVELPYSRTLELEADELGIRFMQRACVPSHGARIFAALGAPMNAPPEREAASSTPLSHYLSSHPHHTLRGDAAAAVLARLELETKAHCSGPWWGSGWGADSAAATWLEGGWVERALTFPQHSDQFTMAPAHARRKALAGEA